MEMDDQILIEKYFEGDLDEKGLSIFQEKLESDAAFAEAFRMEEDIMAGIEMFGNEELRKQLEKIGEEESGGAKIKNINAGRRRWLWGAAAVFALAVVGRFVLGRNEKTTEELYAEYAVHDFSFTEQSSGGNDLAEAEKYLKRSEYAEAKTVLNKYLRENPEDVQARMALGISHLELGESAEALSIFKKTEVETPALKNDAIWYVALAFLKKGDVKSTKEELKKISQNSARYKMAVQLLAELPD